MHFIFASYIIRTQYKRIEEYISII